MKTLRAFISRNDSRISRHNAPLTADGKAEKREAGREMEGDGPERRGLFAVVLGPPVLVLIFYVAGIQRECRSFGDS